MDDQELEQQGDFSLDDIMKEFAPEDAAVPTAQPEAPAVQEEAAEEQMEAGSGQTEAAGDTLRVELPPREERQIPDMEQTQRFVIPGTEPEEDEDTAGEADDEAEEEYEEEYEEEPEEAGPEDAFADGWEPEYEQPMGEYIPPQPIVFRPRSRLRELKRKLIAGPEKRYYELSEKGVIRLQAAIFLNLLVVLVSVGATVMYAMDGVLADRMRLMVFVQFFAMMVSALLGSYQMIEGVADLLKKRFSLNTLLVVTFAACLADGIIGLKELRIPCCAAFSIEMLMSLWSAYHKRVTEIGQMDTLRKAVRLEAVMRSPDYYDGKDGLLRGEGQVEDFMDVYQEPAKPERTLGNYGLLALLVSLVAAVVAAVLHGLSLGIQVLAVSLLAAMPATAFITVSRPTAVLEKRLHRLGSLICGWQGVEGMNGKLVFPLEHSDLFPAGACKMNGVKFYGDRESDEVVEYAAAVMEAAGGGLAPLFTQLLDSRNGRHYDVINLNAYSNGGIGGEVNDEPVLLGNLSFMKEMGVEIPEGIQVDQAVYVAIDGELCGLFAITYGKSRSSAAGVATLGAYKGLNTVLTTGDFMLTEDFIRSKFGVKTRRMAFPEPAVRQELEAKLPEEGALVCALTTTGGLAPNAYAVTGARALRTATRLGVFIHMLGGIVGLAMMVVLAVLGRADLLTPMNMLLYELVWMVPGLLITEWTRAI